MFNRRPAIDYINEELWFSHLGHFLIFLSFTATLFSLVSYFMATRSGEQKTVWNRLGRIGFTTHVVAVVSIFGLLFYLILQHKYQFYYVWRHSSNSLPLKYMISCFWEGQEGSFLLWQFWNGVLGLILIRTAKRFESHVMSVMALIELALATMVLGIHIFGVKIGLNPFLMLREMMPHIPLFNQPNYVALLQDGNGLNALLQNYWMVIHPPVLFLGFASTSIPFAYAIAAIWTKDEKQWMQSALPWTLFSGAALGTGILMGGAWAYESLSFGGFWAWDPVENASLVPWLCLIAGLHVLLVSRFTGKNKWLTVILLMSAFWLVLFSTFLTRSGILGETSVHSFTDEGLFWQLVVFVMAFVVLGLVLMFMRMFNQAKSEQSEQQEPFWSREFWMFLGALILVLAGFQITFTTCIPLWNGILSFFGLAESKMAPPTDIEAHYNSIQIWVAIVIGALTGLVQYFSYKTSWKGKRALVLAGAAVVALVLTIIISLSIEIPWLQSFSLLGGGTKFTFISPYILLLFAGLFAVLANGGYAIAAFKKSLTNYGGSMAHLGFGLMLVGILISQYKQEVISLNIGKDAVMVSEDKERNKENKLLPKGVPIKMAGYEVTYLRDREGIDQVYYDIHYLHEATGDTFTLVPYTQRNVNNELVSHPATRHYWNQDVFTHITSFSIESTDDYFESLDSLSVKDTMFTSQYMVILDTLVPNPQVDTINYAIGDVGIGVRFLLKDVRGNVHELMPVYLISAEENNRVISFPAYQPSIDVEVMVNAILPDVRKVAFTLRERNNANDFVVMKAIVFPYINVLWIGIIIMVMGFLLSAYKRAKEVR